MVAVMTFGERLKELRLRKKLSQEKLARLADVSVGAVRKLEQTDHNPTWETAKKLAGALNVSLDDLAD